MASSTYTPSYSISEHNYSSGPALDLSLNIDLIRWETRHYAPLVFDCASMRLNICLSSPPSKAASQAARIKSRKKREYEPTSFVHRSEQWHSLSIKHLEWNGWKKVGYAPVVLNLEDKVLTILSNREAEVPASVSVYAQTLFYIDENGGGWWILDRLMFLLGVWSAVAWYLRAIGLL